MKTVNNTEMTNNKTWILKNRGKKKSKILLPVAASLIGFLAPISVSELESKSLFREEAAFASEPYRIPDEYESTAGHSLAFSNSGVAATAGLSSVKMNPAMLPLEKQYRVSAGYHWPSVGREYYQAGIVDSTSSKFAAGVTYTSSQEDYLKLNQFQNSAENEEGRENRYQAEHDTPVKKRISVAIGRVFNSFSLGIGGQFIEAWDINKPSGSQMIKGKTLGMGIAGLILPSLRFGISAENMANSNIKNYAPRMYRAGLAYMLYQGNLSVHLDYRDRERAVFEYGSQKIGLPDIYALAAASPAAKNSQIDRNIGSEKMITVSFSVRVQNMIRFLGAYGQEIGGVSRKNVSGGIAVVNEKITFSYLVSSPYFSEDSRLHQAINMGFEVSI